jgi:hypothetical protein
MGSAISFASRSGAWATAAGTVVAKHSTRAIAKRPTRNRAVLIGTERIGVCSAVNMSVGLQRLTCASFLNSRRVSAMAVIIKDKQKKSVAVMRNSRGVVVGCVG